MKSSYAIPAAIVFGGIIIATAIYISMPKSSPEGKASLVRPVSTSDHILGNPAAPVMIIEYSDFDCGFCKGFNDTLHEVIANEGASGKVAWVFREFPLTEIHPDAFALARAAECAASVASSDPTANNDAFWRFASALYMNQPVDPSNLGAIASSVGISSEAFATCYANASPSIDARITADRQNALLAGATGAPFSVILTNGKNPVVMNGAYSYNAVKQLVDQALGNYSPTSPSL
ncbi:thioredoxin domain-containing protein [Candidatus Parcubacteria bacterium]|nr:thioredoxin domain-containing protein [Candidatus Parcubacteria bacterium]